MIWENKGVGDGEDDQSPSYMEGKDQVLQICRSNVVNYSQEQSQQPGAQLTLQTWQAGSQGLLEDAVNAPS